LIRSTEIRLTWWVGVWRGEWLALIGWRDNLATLYAVHAVECVHPPSVFNFHLHPIIIFTPGLHFTHRKFKPPTPISFSKICPYNLVLMCFLGDVKLVSGENFKEAWGRWNHMCMCIKNCRTLPVPSAPELTQPFVLTLQCLILRTFWSWLKVNENLRQDDTVHYLFLSKLPYCARIMITLWKCFRQEPR
jgi:hypothetical protein